MTPLPQHGEPAGDAFLAIQKLARRTGADVQELLTLYALEGLVVSRRSPVGIERVIVG